MLSKITKYTLGLTLAMGTLFPNLQAQVAVNVTEDQFVKNSDTTQHAEWHKGKNQFPGKPRDMWQIGIGGGSFIISGDVKSQFGWGASVHARKSIGYALSLRMEYMFGQARGLNYQASSLGGFPTVSPFSISADGQSISQPDLYGAGDLFYANYKLPQYHAASIQAVINLNNIRFHKPSNKWSVNAILGLGFNAYQSFYDALDGNGAAYDFRNVANGLDPAVLGDRRTIRDNVKGITDGKYETQAQINNKNLVTFGKDGQKFSVTPFFSTGFSFEYLVTPRLSIALEHQVFFSADDYLDGKSRKENGSLTSNTDIAHYTSLRLGFHIGKKSKRVQPLWFVNPLLHPMQDIADLKGKLDDDWFKDDDKDGVPNKLDEEPNSDPLAMVDSKGKTLDSDKDGVPDHKDEEPFSPPGFPVNEVGVAQVPKPIYPDQVKVDGHKLVIGDEVYELACNPACGGGGPGGDAKDWYLPMINFNLDKYELRPDAYGKIRQVADIMQKYPSVKIVVHGHTDTRASNEYNDMLSYNRVMSAIDYLKKEYKIDGSRFIVKIDGKRDNLINTAKGDEEHFMNRRVEFYISDGKEASQPRPAEVKGNSRKWKY
jgi:outer membrane protein OmpA-like peptidoglycan-associated protein